MSPNPFLLAATIRKHIQQYEVRAAWIVEAFTESLCVEDFISSSCDVEGAVSVTMNAKEILSHAVMNLSKYIDKLTRSEVQVERKWNGKQNRNKLLELHQRF